MKSLTKFWLLGFLVMLVTTPGCTTWNAKIEDMSDVYSKPAIAGAPKVIITDLTDNRRDKKLVGRISARNLTTETPINIIITNRIASKLREAGFNIQKVELTGLKTKSELAEVLNRNNGKILFTGILRQFFIESSDAASEMAIGRVSFRIDILDERGEPLLSSAYSTSTRKNIGLDDRAASEELIKETIQAGVNKLVRDSGFQRFLSQVKNK